MIQRSILYPPSKDLVNTPKQNPSFCQSFQKHLWVSHLWEIILKLTQLLTLLSTLKNEQSHLQHSSILQITMLSNYKDAWWLNHCFSVTPKISPLIITCPSFFPNCKTGTLAFNPPSMLLGIREIMFSMLLEVHLCYSVHKALIMSQCYSQNLHWLPSTH